MNRIAQDVQARRAAGSVDLDGLPCIAIILRDTGETSANLALFKALGMEQVSLVNRTIPVDLLRQLDEISRGLSTSTQVWLDRVTDGRCAMTVTSWNRTLEDDGCIFLIAPPRGDDKTAANERLVAETEQRYRTLFEESAEPIYIRIGKKTVFVSESFVKMLGYDSAAELRNVSHKDLMAPHHRQLVEDIIKRREAGDDVSERYEVDLVGKQGQIVSTESYGRKIVWDGQPAVSAVFRDITEQKENLERIQQNATIRRKMLDALPIGIIVHDRGELLHINTAFARLLDYDNAHSLMESGKSLFDYFVDKDAIAARSRSRLLGEPEPTTYEAQMIGVSGREFSVRIDVGTMVWEGSEVTLGSITDISDTMRAKRELQTTEARLRDYVKTAAHWFWEVDANDLFVEVSDGFEQLTGTSKDVLIGSRRSDLFESMKVDFIENEESYFDAMKSRESFADIKYWLTLEDGQRHAFSIGGVPIFSESGIYQGFRGTAREITDEIKMQEAIKFAATHDDLTGLINRRVLTSRIAMSLEGSVLNNEKDSRRHDFLCVMDLDGLKVINDTAGHNVGDEMIRQCAIMFRQGASADDYVARLGGDEFGILFSNRTREEIEESLDSLLQRVTSYRFYNADQAYNVGFSAGIVQIDDSFGSVDDVYSCADLSCYASKERGRGSFQFYVPSDSEISRRRVEMQTANEIQQAIDEQRLVVHAQPIVSLQSAVDAPVHHELLVRMVQRDGKMVPPGAFIRAAERFNLAPSIDLYVLENALQQLTQYLENGGRVCPPITVNVSGESLGGIEFSDSVNELFARYPLVEPQLVCFEITETATIRNLDLATGFIGQMRDHGCSFALDDFGTGLSSFSYLKDLDVDIIKIDGVFIRDIANDRVNRAVVSSICEVAKSLDRLVVAECVEDKATVNMLTALGVDYGQGYIWARPQPFADILKARDAAFKGR